MYCCVERSHYRTSRTECRYREIEENEHTKWGYSICVNRLVLETSAHTHRVKRPKITIHVPPPKQNEENNPESTTQREIRNDVTEWIGRWTSRKRFVTRVSVASFSLLFCFLLFFFFGRHLRVGVSFFRPAVVFNMADVGLFIRPMGSTIDDTRWMFCDIRRPCALCLIYNRLTCERLGPFLYLFNGHAKSLSKSHTPPLSWPLSHSG